MRFTLHTFSKMARQQETVIRAMMPKTAAADQEPAEPARTPARTTVTVRRLPSGARLVKPLTATLGEVARG